VAAEGDHLYSLADGSNHLVALTGTDGKQYLATDGTAFQWVSQDRTLPFNLVVLLVFAVPMLGALLLPVVALVRRLRHRPRAVTRPWRAARWLAAGAATAGLGFLVALFAVLTWGGAAFLYGVPVYFTVLLAVPVLVLLAAATALGYTVIGWRASGAGVLARIHQVGLLVGLTALAWFLWLESDRLAVLLMIGVSVDVVEWRSPNVREAGSCPARSCTTPSEPPTP
jgi:hypothetical protein